MKESEIREFFFDLFKDHKRELIVIIAIATFGAILSAGIPYLYGRLFDLALVPNTTLTLLLSLIGIWAVLGLISNYTSAKTSELGGILGVKTSFESEVEAYGHFLTLPVSFHKNKKTGSVLEKISRGSWHIQYFVQIFSELLPSLLFLFFSLATMLFIKWELGLIVIFTFIIYSFVTLKFIKPVLQSEEKMRKVFEKEYGSIYDSLYNVFLIKNFAMEEKEKNKIFNSLISRIIPPYRTNLKSESRLSYMQGIVYNLGFIIVLGMAILFLRQGYLTQGEFIMFFGYINLSFSPFFRLNDFYRFYKKASVALKRIIRLKKMVPEEMKHGNKVIKELKGKIDFRDVHFSYTKNKETLKGISLEIASGESIALVGESGVGKTTLSELILGYYKPSKGNVFLDNVNLSELKLKWLREQIAIVPQEINVFNDTLMKNLKFANPLATREDIIKAAKAANAHDFIMSLPKKYETIVGERGVKLSVGQKQRIAIAMAFIKNPRILILDEPTAALDAESERKVQEGIQQLIKDRTTIIIAHRFSTVKNVDKIIVLDKGKIFEIGNHEQLMRKKGKYYHLYTLQKGLD